MVLIWYVIDKYMHEASSDNTVLFQEHSILVPHCCFIPMHFDPMGPSSK